MFYYRFFIQMYTVHSIKYTSMFPCFDEDFLIFFANMQQF